MSDGSDTVDYYDDHSHHDAHNHHHNSTDLVHYGDDFVEDKNNRSTKTGNASQSQKTSITESVKANFSKEASTLSKITRAVFGFGSMVLVVDGVKKILSPKVRQDGDKQPDLIPELAEAGVGAIGIYASLVHGGAEKIAKSAGNFKR